MRLIALTIIIVIIYSWCNTNDFAFGHNLTYDQINIRNYRRSEAIMKRVWPIIKMRGDAAIIYYNSDCSDGPDSVIIFPYIDTSRTRGGRSTMDELRSVFKDERHLEIEDAHDHLFKINFGRPSKEILDTNISKISFSPFEQYNAAQAIFAIERSRDVRLAEQRLGVHQMGRMTTGLLVGPSPQLPHMPASLSNKTVNDALDIVARTFGAIVVFGTCQSGKIYDIYVPRQYNYFEN